MQCLPVSPVNHWNRSFYVNNPFQKILKITLDVLLRYLKMTFSKTRDLKVDRCHSNFYVMLKQLLFFYKFYNFFCRRHSLMNRPCYNNIFQLIQHDNFWNLNRVFFTHWKLVESRVNALWCYFPVIRPYLMKSAPIPGNQSSFEILQLFDIWRSQSLVIFFLVLLICWIRLCLSCIAEQSSFRRTVT